MPTCLLFDSDGTLVDSELLNNDALSAELADSGINETADRLVSRYRGWNFFKVLPDLQQRHNVVLDDSFTERFRERASQHFSEHLLPVNGIESALSELDHPKCVASNAPMKKLRHVLEVTGLYRHFTDRLYSAYEINSWKPALGLFLHAAARMGFEPGQCIVVEDSEVGVEAACAAGMSVVLYDPAGISPHIHANETIASMLQLPDAVARLSRN